MKRLFLLFAISLFSLGIFAQEYKVVTVVESIIPGGAGRSRIIETKTNIDVATLTTERTDGKDSKQGDIDRSDAKVGAFAETKLLNFFSLVGINFQNIASNDAIISSKINTLAKDGWKLVFVTSGVESDCGDPDKGGIFITRLFFSK